MDQMLPSPSFNIPSIGTPHHVMEEDAMINPQAQAAQQSRQGGPTSNLQNHSTPNSGSSNPFGFGGMTPQSFFKCWTNSIKSLAKSSSTFYASRTH